MKDIEIDLSTEEEIEHRFNQICFFLSTKALSGEPPHNMYDELSAAAIALREHFCQHKDHLAIEDVNPVLMDAIPAGTFIHVDSKQKISAVNIMFQEDE